MLKLIVMHWWRVMIMIVIVVMVPVHATGKSQYCRGCQKQGGDLNFSDHSIESPSSWDARCVRGVHISGTSNQQQHP
jgi:hypothetical protein